MWYLYSFYSDLLASNLSAETKIFEQTKRDTALFRKMRPLVPTFPCNEYPEFILEKITTEEPELCFYLLDKGQYTMEVFRRIVIKSGSSYECSNDVQALNLMGSSITKDTPQITIVNIPVEE